MRSIKHLTPRYVLNRLAIAGYEKRNPDVPWLTPEANALLEGLLLGSDRGLEWGSGRSTLWLGERVHSLTSVEHDPRWHAEVQQRLASGVSSGNIDHRLVADDSPNHEERYVGVAEGFGDGELDLVLVDGLFRRQCVEVALAKVNRGGMIVLDNAERYLPHPTHSPASVNRRGAPDAEWLQVEHSLRDWRRIWTSSGVTDTIIWIRP